MGESLRVKTTLEIPDPIFRRAKSAAAQKGIPLREFVTEAISEKLSARTRQEKPWMNSFGKLRNLRSDIAQINKVVQEEFGDIEPEDWK